ncbi:MAG: hypothetical protein IPN17_15860 [Deltaproteobacteria bacterium]|nr:hypothetical protein [Deltaproteobacteria bacterium]
MVAARLTFPAALTVLLQRPPRGVTENADETRTWEYEALTPMPIYDLHIGAYDQWVDQETPAAANGVTIHHYDYRSMVAQGNAAYADIHDAMNFYTDTFGPYRWGPMSFLQEPAIGGGMEHATVVSMEETMFTCTSRGPVVAIHELAHHWSGNPVRVATWNDLWPPRASATTSPGGTSSPTTAPPGASCSGRRSFARGCSPSTRCATTRSSRCARRTRRPTP